MRSLFFNAEPTTDLERHPTGYDREYDADSHAAFFEPLFGPAGVLLTAGSEDPCCIYSKGGGILGIKAGAAYVKGRMVAFDGTETLAAATGHVVARMNKGMEVRGFQLLVVDVPIQGTGDIYDLPLANVSVSGSNVSISDERVFLTAKVLGGHRHQITELDGVAPLSHKHAASDISSGVMASERLPYLTDGSRFDHQTDITYINQTVAAGSSATITIPFTYTMSARPAKVVLYVRQGRPNSIQTMLRGGLKDLVTEIFPRSGNGVDGWLFGATGGEDSLVDGYIRAYFHGLEAQGDMVQFARMGSGVWYGPFGNAFVSSATNIEVQVDTFKITASGVSFRINNTGSNPATAYFGAFCEVFE